MGGSDAGTFVQLFSLFHLAAYSSAEASPNQAAHQAKVTSSTSKASEMSETTGTSRYNLDMYRHVTNHQQTSGCRLGSSPSMTG